MTKIMNVPNELRLSDEFLDAIDMAAPGDMLNIRGRIVGVISHTPIFFDATTLRTEDRKLYGSIDAMLASASARSLLDAVTQLDAAGAIKGDAQNPHVRINRLKERYAKDRGRRAKITEETT